MEQTNKLRVKVSAKMGRNCIAINPNEGLDLNLLQFSYDVKMFMGSNKNDAFMEGNDGNDGNISQPNEVALGVCEMNSKDVVDLGSPKFIIIHRDDNKLLLTEQSR